MVHGVGIVRDKTTISGNNKYWIVETSHIYIRLVKHPDSKGVIRQCYITVHPLGHKTLTGKKGEATFENIIPEDVSR